MKALAFVPTERRRVLDWHLTYHRHHDTKIPPLITPVPMMYHHHRTTAIGAIANTYIPSSAAPVGFFKLLLAFTAGGLFFSTVLSLVAATTAFGLENFRIFLSIVNIVRKRTWKTLILGLKETRSALRRNGKWNWIDAWRTLKSKLLITRNTATDCVDALRAERLFFAAAVGVPGLIPVQHAIDRLWPFSFATFIEEKLKEAVEGVKNDNIGKIILTKFSLGNATPQLLATRIYEIPDAIAFDVDTRWDSDLVAEVKLKEKNTGLTLPVTLQKLTLEGTIRVELTPLIKDWPGYGASLLSLSTLPKVGLDLKVAGGEIMKIPWLRNEIMDAIIKILEDELLWPKRAVIPTPEEPQNPKSILSKRELDNLLTSDPLSDVETKLAEKPMLYEYMQSLKPDNTLINDQVRIFADGDEDEAFDSIDTDGNGELSREEFMKAMDIYESIHDKIHFRKTQDRKESKKERLKKLDKLFDDIDINGDERISRQEFRAAVNRVEEAPRLSVSNAT